MIKLTLSGLINQHLIFVVHLIYEHSFENILITNFIKTVQLYELGYDSLKIKNMFRGDVSPVFSMCVSPVWCVCINCSEFTGSLLPPHRRGDQRSYSPFPSGTHRQTVFAAIQKSGGKKYWEQGESGGREGQGVIYAEV